MGQGPRGALGLAAWSLGPKAGGGGVQPVPLPAKKWGKKKQGGLDAFEKRTKKMRKTPQEKGPASGSPGVAQKARGKKGPGNTKQSELSGKRRRKKGKDTNRLR